MTPRREGVASLSVLLGPLLALSIACGNSHREPVLQAKDTNVLWLTLCTVRADRLGAYGHAGGNSPHLDRLAAEGVLFGRALAQTPWTRPSIAAMVTGVYPRTLGMGIPKSDRKVKGSALNPRFKTIAEHFHSAGYETFGVTANPNTNAAFQFDRGYDHYRDTGILWRDGYANSKLSAEDITKVLLAWLNNRSDERPFFAHLVFVDIHNPYRDALAQVRLQDRGSDSLPKAPYDLQVRYLDDVIGELFGELDSLGLHNTLMVVNSDHGEGLGDRGPDDHGHGVEMFNTRLTVPLIFHHPGLPLAGIRLDEPVENVDILPTVLELLGLSWSGNEIDGRSLAPSILQGKEPVRRPEYVAETGYKGEHRSAILSGEWKLILDHRLQREGRGAGIQLY